MRSETAASRDDARRTAGQRDLDKRCIDTIRTLAIDAVEKAQSGHAGTPMALALVAYTLWQRFLRYDPSDPLWPALMEIPVFHIFTHHSIGLGEDGPTHQPIEQLVALRAIPNIVVLRPADANEVREAYKVIMALTDRPACLVLSRQKLPTFDRSRYAAADGLARGAYVM